MSFKNKKKSEFLKKIPKEDLEGSDIHTRSKFNFSYFDDSQPSGQKLSDWNNDSGICTLVNLIEKFKEYSRQPLNYWQNQRAGAGSLKILELYDCFPKDSDFSHPAHVPHNVKWGRFRLGNKVRVVGFVIPKNLGDNTSSNIYDFNTFYIVFLDREHKFFKTEVE